MLFQISDLVKQKQQDLENIKKVKKSNSVIQFIADLEERVQHLNYPYLLLDTKEKLDNYLAKAENKDWIVGIDTETTGLSPLEDRLVGMSLFIEDELPAYVPINHIDYITLERISNQLTTEDAKEVLEKYPLKYLLHNSTFDIRFIENNLGIRIKPFWDTLIAGKCLNENEDSHGLKNLHTKYISKEKNSKFNELFKDLTFDKVPIRLGAPYAAYDAQMTWELYNFQSKYLNPENKKGEMDKVYRNFREIEMPILEVIVDMEQRGVAADFKVLDILKEKYSKQLEEKKSFLYNLLAEYEPQIIAYNESRVPNENGKLPLALDIPLNISSPAQLAIFIYDIQKNPSFSRDEPRSTGIDAIQKLNNDFGKALLAYREAEKMLGTFIEPMYKYAKVDGRIHSRYNSLGAKTGRFSSTEPNSQNIPARGNKSELRNIFSGGIEYKEYPEQEVYIFEKCEEIQLSNREWVFVETLKPGDILIDGEVVKAIKVKDGWLGKVGVKI